MSATRNAHDPASAIAEELRKRDNIIVAAHAAPDGDAIGSTAAMGWLLRSLGKRFALYNASGLPAGYSWVSMPGPLLSSLDALPFEPELLVALDCGDARRLGPELAPVLASLPSINMDHHPDNPHFASRKNWVDPRMAAAGQMVAELALAAGAPLSGGLAEGVCLALVSDTGSFAFGNTSAAVFRLMALLMENGLNFAELREHMDAQWSLAKSHMWGRLLGNVERRCGGRLVLCLIRREDMDACGAEKNDLEGFVELLRRHRGAEVAATLREDAPERCKLSLRSFGEIDVRALAARFGGGGHRNAAGAMMCGPLDCALENLIAAAREVLNYD